MIGRFLRTLFGRRDPSVLPTRTRRPRPLVADADFDAPPGALTAEDIEDRFFRLVYGFPAARSSSLSADEQAVLRHVRDAFGGDRIDIATLPRLPAAVQALMGPLHSARTDSLALVRRIEADPTLADDVVHAVNHSPHVAGGHVRDVSGVLGRVGYHGLQRVVMQVAMRPVLRRDTGPASRAAGERLWEQAGRSARASAFLAQPDGDPFESWLAGLVSQTGVQPVLVELEKWRGLSGVGYSQAFVAAAGLQAERIALHAARQWGLPPRVLQALAERADPADGGLRTPLGRALLAASRIAMLDVLIEHGLAEPGSVLKATPSQGIGQARLIACRSQLRRPMAVVAES